MRSGQRSATAKVQLFCGALVVVISSRQWREGVEVAKKLQKHSEPSLQEKNFQLKNKQQMKKKNE